MYTKKSFSFQYRRIAGMLLIVAMLIALTPPQAAQAASHWSALGSGLDASVSALAFDGSGNLYAGGNFTNYIAKWDGSSYTTLGSGLNNTVSALAIDGSGNLYAGGSFTTAGGASANYIAKWDGSAWSTLGSGLSGSVSALVFDGSGNLYAGGSFTTAGGASANYIAKWDGSSWSALGSGMGGQVSALAFKSGNLYAGGSFTTAGGASANYIAKWDGSAWSALGSGRNGIVYALAIDGSGNLYAGDDVPGSPNQNRVAKWDGSSWSILGTWNYTVPSSYTYALAVDGSGNLYAGGSFFSAAGVSVNNVAMWNGSSWSALGSGMNNTVYALTIYGSGNLYAGGNFTTAGGISTNHIVKYQNLPTPGTFSKTSPSTGAMLNTIIPTLSWATSESAISYTYCVDEIDNGLCDTSWLPAGSNTYAQPTGLHYNTTYYWHIQAHNADGSTDANNNDWWNFKIGFNKTSPINFGTYQLIDPILSWGASKFAVNYAYCIDKVDNNLCDTSWISTGFSTIADLSGLDKNATYYWQVAATDADGTTYLSSNDWWKFSTSVASANWLVTNTNDTGAGSLRAAISSAASNSTRSNTITFDPSLSGGIIRLSSVLTLSQKMIIDGSALALPITISGDTDGNGTGNVRVFSVSSGVQAKLKALTIIKGYSSASQYSGGGIYNAGTLVVTDSALSSNSRDFYGFWSNSTGLGGGGISNVGGLMVTDSAFISNSATAVTGCSSGTCYVTPTNPYKGGGGGIYNSGTLTVSNSTFYSNSASNSVFGGLGGGINNAGTLAVMNSTFSNNTGDTGHYSPYIYYGTGGIYNSNLSMLNYTNTILANSTGDECSTYVGTIGISTRNLVESGGCYPYLTGDPNLGALADNGGLTKTMALLAGSPAMDAGDNTSCTVTDQRGMARPQDGDTNGSAVCDIGAYEHSAVNIPPTISDITDKTTNENTATGSITFTIGDADTPMTALSVTVTSSNTTLVPNENIVQGGGVSRTINITPASDQSGTTTITVTVNDGTATASDTFLLTVNIPNNPPTISDITDKSTNEDTATGSIAFTVGDVETPAASLIVTATSSNTTLVPNGNITPGGSGASRTINIMPASNQNGTTTVTVTVNDGIAIASDTFLLTVNAVNDPPTISNITDKSTNEDTATGDISFTVGDLETSADSLLVTATSSNTTLIPNGNITLSGSDASRAINIMPVSNQSGTTTITVTVNDGAITASDTFLLTVNAVNDLPTISDISDKSTNEDTATEVIAFTVGDVETPATSLLVTATSSNITLVPNANITLGGSGASRTIKITPASNQSGTTTITATVNDGTGTTCDTFVLTVNAVNDPPTISNIIDKRTDIDAATGNIAFTVGDVETPAASLTVTATSSNTTLVPNENITLGGSNTDRTINITPASNQSGTTTITVTVDDGTDTASDTFLLTVNDPPTIMSIIPAGINPIDGAGVDFTVTFDKPVTGVDKADFSLTKIGSIMGASVVKVVAVSQSIYTVTVNTGVGNGSIRLDLPVTASIQDLSANAFVGPYTSGETYSPIIGPAPTVPVLTSPANNFLVTGYTPTLDWNDSSQVMALATTGWHYEVQVTAPFGAYNKTFNTAENTDPALGLGTSTFTIPDANILPANTTFTWRVRSFDGAYRYSAWSLTRTFRTKLATPILISPMDDPAASTLLDNKRPTFIWEPVSGATGYTLQVLREDPKTHLFTVVANTGTIKAPSNTYTPAVDLLPGTTYTWKVVATGVNVGVYSVPFTFKTGVNTPAVPTLVAPANNILVNNTAVLTLKWSLVDDKITPAASFEVEYASNAAFASSIHPAAIAVPIKELNFGPLSSGTYYWHVRSWSGAGATGTHSAWSAVRTIKVSGATPVEVAPTVPVLTSPASNSLVTNYTPKLDWANSSQVMALAGNWHYEVQVTAPFGAYDEIFTTTVNADPAIGLGESQYTIPDENILPANTTFTWKVRSAYNNGVTTQYSAWSLTRTFRTKLATPTLTSPVDDPTASTPLDNKRPTFVWEPVSGATGYTLQILKEDPKTHFYTVVANTGTIKAPANTYAPTVDLLPSTIYTWRVVATGVNAGVYSAPCTFKTGLNTPAVPVLVAPANNILVDSTVAQTLSWKPGLSAISLAAVSFEVAYSTNSDFADISPTNTVTLVPVNANSVSGITLSPGRPYYWRVRSWSGIDATGTHSAWSVVRMIKVKFVAPVLDSVVGTSGSPTFTWYSENGLWTNYTLTILNSNTNKVVKSFTVPAPITTYTIPVASLPTGIYKWQVKINGLYTPISSAISSGTFDK